MPLFAWALIFLVASTAIQALLVKPQNSKPAALEDFDFPQADEGTPQTVFFGDCWTAGWMVLWYGNYRTKKIKKGGIFGIGKQTVGYKYFMSLFQGIGRWGVNEVVDITVGGLSILDEPICLDADGVLVEIDKPELFGGSDKEGGIQGPMYIYSGYPDQELQGALASGVGTLPDIAATLGGDVPNFRGVVTAWFDGLICAMNPYPKEWKWRVRRTVGGWFNDSPWYAPKATISLESNGKTIRAMNAAHILYETNTNPEWGRGMPVELLDENSYIRAANQLCDEGLGLCIPWFRQESIKEFLPIVINHIAAVQYVDRQTGKLTIRLIRNDYDVDDLPLFTPETGLLDVQDEDASGEDTAFNEIMVKGFDPTTQEDIMVRWHNLASIQNLGEIISNTIEYKGLCTRDQVARVAEREGQVQLPLRKMLLTFDRRAWRIAPGEPFRISVPSKGISNMVVRAGEINDGTLRDGKITIKVVEEVFSMPETSYVEPTDPTWEAPNFSAEPSPETRLIEMGYRDLLIRMDTDEGETFNENSSYVGELAKIPPGVQTYEYDLNTKTGAEEYETRLIGNYTAWLTLAGDIAALDDTLTVAADNRAAFLAEFTAGMAVLVDDEQMEFTTFDSGTGIATLKRGVADTIPAAHLAGATIWLVDDELVSDGREYADGVTVNAKVLVRTSADLLPLADAVEDSVVTDQRPLRPYPPGDVEIDGEPFVEVVPGTLYTEPVLTWVDRDRLEAPALIDHSAAGVGPEAGTSYIVRVLVSGTPIREDDVGSLLTWTYDLTMQGTDGDPASVTIQLASKRDDLESYFSYSLDILLGEPPFMSTALGVLIGASSLSSIGSSIAAITAYPATIYDPESWNQGSGRLQAPSHPSITLIRPLAGHNYTNGSVSGIRKYDGSAFSPYPGYPLLRSISTGSNRCAGAGAIIPVSSGDQFEHWLESAQSTSFETVPGNWFSIEVIPPGTRYALVMKSAAQVIAATTTTKLTWDIELVDTLSCHDNSVNNDQFVVPADTTGKMRVTASIQTTAAVSNRIYFTVNLNGNRICTRDMEGNSSTKIMTIASRIIDVVPGDILDVDVFVTAGCSIADTDNVWACVEELPADHRYCIAYKGSNQTLPSSTGVIVTFPDTELHDPEGLHDTATNSDKINVPPDATEARVTYWLEGNPSQQFLTWGTSSAGQYTGQPEDENHTGGSDAHCAMGAWVDCTSITFFQIGAYASASGIMNLGYFQVEFR